MDKQVVNKNLRMQIVAGVAHTCGFHTFFAQHDTSDFGRFFCLTATASYYISDNIVAVLKKFKG